MGNNGKNITKYNEEIFHECLLPYRYLIRTQIRFFLNPQRLNHLKNDKIRGQL